MNSTVRALRGGVGVASESREADSGLFFTPKLNGDAEVVFVMQKEHFHQGFANIVMFRWTKMRVVLYLQGQTSY